MLSTLFANDVRQTLDQFRRSVDQAYENYYGQGQNGSQPGSERNWAFSPILESAWSEHALTIRAILPGVAENDVNVSVQNNQLLIEGERKAPEAFDKNATTQVAYGRFRAAVALPSGLDVDKTRCNLRHGMLDIQIPVLEASKPKQIPIQNGEAQKTITS